MQDYVGRIQMKQEAEFKVVATGECWKGGGGMAKATIFIYSVFLLFDVLNYILF